MHKHLCGMISFSESICIHFSSLFLVRTTLIQADYAFPKFLYTEVQCCKGVQLSHAAVTHRNVTLAKKISNAFRSNIFHLWHLACFVMCCCLTQKKPFGPFIIISMGIDRHQALDVSLQDYGLQCTLKNNNSCFGKRRLICWDSQVQIGCLEMVKLGTGDGSRQSLPGPQGTPSGVNTTFVNENTPLFIEIPKISTSPRTEPSIGHSPRWKWASAGTGCTYTPCMGHPFCEWRCKNWPLASCTRAISGKFTL